MSRLPITWRVAKVVELHLQPEEHGSGPKRAPCLHRPGARGPWLQGMLASAPFHPSHPASPSLRDPAPSPRPAHHFTLEIPGIQHLPLQCTTDGVWPLSLLDTTDTLPLSQARPQNADLSHEDPLPMCAPQHTHAQTRSTDVCFRTPSQELASSQIIHTAGSTLSSS